MVRFEVAADITEQRSVNQERMELEKLGAIGRLTAGVAYELNNPIMGMINAIQFCIDQTGMDDERHEVLAKLSIETSAALGPVLLRPNYFEQIVINLLTNALDAVANTTRTQIHIGLAMQGDE